MTVPKEITSFVASMDEGEYSSRDIHDAAHAVVKFAFHLEQGKAKPELVKLVFLSKFIHAHGHDLVNLSAYAHALKNHFVLECWRCHKHEFESKGPLMTDGARDKLLCGGCLDEIGPPSKRTT